MSVCVRACVGEWVSVRPAALHSLCRERERGSWREGAGRGWGWGGIERARERDRGVEVGAAGGVREVKKKV